MSDWKRVTKEVALTGLPAEMRSVIEQHVERYHLGPILAGALMCIQTDSEKVKKGLFGKGETVQLGAIVTPRWLVWAVQGTKTPAIALSAQLSHVTIQDYAQTPFAKMVPDAGIEVSGVFTDASESVSAFIGVDESTAGQKFKQTVMQAAQNAKK